MEVSPTEEQLEAKLLEYIKNNSHLPRQRTTEWLNFKTTTIGGSQISTIQGNNPYESVRSLVEKKVGLKCGFDSNIKTQWGTLFEDILRRYVEHDRSCKVLADDIMVSNSDTISYSPDGLGIVKKEELVEIIEPGQPPKYTTVARPRIALFEFKCPFNRIPDGKIPGYYLPQVKTGLDIIPIVDVGLYVEAVFRRCGWGDLNHLPTYDKQLVPRTSGRNVLAYGFVGFYSDVSEWLGEAELELKQLEAIMIEDGYEINDTNDLGECTPQIFHKIMSLFDRKHIKPWYSSTVYLEGPASHHTHDATSEQLDAFVEECRGGQSRKYIWGVLPWKLFRVDYHWVDKTPGYLDPYREKISSVISLVKKCLEAPIGERQNLISEYFGGDEGFVYET